MQGIESVANIRSRKKARIARKEMKRQHVDDEGVSTWTSVRSIMILSIDQNKKTEVCRPVYI